MKEVRARTAYADLLRCFSAFCVIFLHVAAQNWYDYGVNDGLWKLFNLQDALVRWTVPVFVMLSGAFLLDPQRPLTPKKLWGKYILRAVIALAFWALFYSFFTRFADYWANYGHIHQLHQSGEFSDLLYNQHLKQKLYPLAWEAVKQAFITPHVHLWYMYMIIGLYIVTPLMRPLTLPENRNLTEYFLLLWLLLTIIIPTLCDLLGDYGVKNYISKFSISYVLGYSGYFLAGYYLRTREMKKWQATLLLALGALGLFATWWLTDVYSVKAGQQTETFYGNLTLNVMLAAVGLFTAFKQFFGRLNPTGWGKKLLNEVSSCTFGIYLIHLFFLDLIQRLGFSNLLFAPALTVPVKTIIVFVLSFLAAALIRRIPLVGKYIA